MILVLQVGLLLDLFPIFDRYSIMSYRPAVSGKTDEQRSCRAALRRSSSKRSREYF